ncbi:hypothetical protein PanWU01x14_348980 [Parasponia andersonii]|uniref:Uncharacterized protein n=1 Tax=Parasponia andersonii TaxID=3476 RepID=A0A2P5ABK5_PARAD|nr:hypothetical protein PanWU01x14_348980 [Parasponia andersonii]
MLLHFFRCACIINLQNITQFNVFETQAQSVQDPRHPEATTLPFKAARSQSKSGEFWPGT